MKEKLTLGLGPPVTVTGRQSVTSDKRQRPADLSAGARAWSGLVLVLISSGLVCTINRLLGTIGTLFLQGLSSLTGDGKQFEPV